MGYGRYKSLYLLTYIVEQTNNVGEKFFVLSIGLYFLGPIKAILGTLVQNHNTLININSQVTGIYSNALYLSSSC
jgi:hypothetical protein